MTTHSSLLTAALDAAARGWHVFPLHAESKRPARPDHRAADCAGPTGLDPWCRPGHAGWEVRATTDTGRIRRAWSNRDFTAWGLGIACGPSQLVVVDLDLPKPDDEAREPWGRFGATCGADVLALLADARHGTITPTWTVRTISGGTHRYYAAPHGCRFGNTAGSLGWLIDTRAHGGYVVAPPTSIAGHAYEVVDDRPPAPLPAWLGEALAERHRPWSNPIETASRPVPIGAGCSDLDRRGKRSARYVAAAVNGEVGKVTEALPGTRNHTLFCAAVALGQLVAGGAIADNEAFAALDDACAGHIAADAFTPAEAEATIRSGFRTGARNPRSAA